MAAGVAIDELKAMLIARLADLVGDFVPDAKRKGAYWIGRNPWRADRHAGSFAVFAEGRAKGGFTDYATGDKGDVIDLIAFAKCGAVSAPPTRAERAEAIRWAKSFLGLATARREEFEKKRAVALDAQRAAERNHEEARRRKRKQAFDLWLCGRDWRDTPVEAYLRARAIDVDALENLDDFVRFHPSVAHFYQRGVHAPCMLAAFRRGALFAGLHLTWLAEDGRGKHPGLAKGEQKLTLGAPLVGAALRLTKGASGLTLEQAEAQGLADTLVAGEGIETALSCAAARPDLRVWAAGSLSLLGSLPASSAVSDYLLVRDNDDGKPGAVKQFEAARRKVEGHGKPVRETRAFVGKDMNDLAQWRAA
jgi:hypothetical protein